MSASPTATADATASEAARVLLVEDDPALLVLLRAAADYGGYATHAVTTGAAALAAVAGGGIDAVLLDLGLPDYDGPALLAELRALSDIPIIVVSGRGSEADKIQALDLGADDFVAKPFLPGELLARLRAALRRYARTGTRPEASGSSARDPIRAGALIVDPFDLSAALHGLKVMFSASEFAILLELVRSPGKVLSRALLLDALYDGEAPDDSNIVDVYVSRIRAKLRTLRADIELIGTVRGAGWRFTPPA